MNFRPAAAVRLGFLGLLLCPFGAARPAPAKAARWNIDLTLTVSGQYRVAEKDRSFAGRYSFRVRWAGSIERDADDWRLIHRTSDLLDWKAEENPSPRSVGRTLTTEDFVARPVFRFHYVLQEQDVIQLDFALEGFDVPLNASSQKFGLVLPASAKTTRPSSGLDYDRHLITGSNQIRFAADELDNARLEKSYGWTWGRFESTLRTEDNPNCHQSHEARLSVVFKPA
jgi:hypothetical protein